MTQGKRRGLILFFVAALLFCIDFFTKGWIDTHMPQLGFSAPFYPYRGIGVFQNILGIDFSINHVSNLGGAWGIFSSHPKILLTFRIVIILSLAVYALFINKIRKRDAPFMLILVGAGANIIDFFRFGAVVDMFHFMLGSYSFPVFNVADMLIFFGVSTLLVQSLIEKRKRKSQNAPQHT